MFEVFKLAAHNQLLPAVGHVQMLLFLHIAIENYI